ncbi:Cullin-2 [Borealophlyctis nickersoniae]|nr:Cullin-2 [Borealophlyctis nickersoniae]
MSLQPKKINFDAVFGVFRGELANMYNYANIKISGIDMFQQVYDMCTARPKPYTEQLFHCIGQFLSEHATGLAQTILQHHDLVTAYATEWEKYMTASGYTNVICQYLNRMLSKMKDPYSNSRTAGDGRYRKMSIEALLELIRRDREGETVPQDTIRKCIHSFGNAVISPNDEDQQQHTDQPLQLYIEEFEKPYLADIREYYMKESNAVISSVSVSEYMHKANQRLAEEAARNARYCDVTSHEKIIKECETQYIAAHQSRVHAEFEAMVAQERFADCTLAYSLLSRIPDGVVSLLDTFEKYIAQLGLSVIAKLGSSVSKDPKEFVESLMDLQAKYMGFVATVFNNDASFSAAVDKAFRTIVNNTSSNANSPEILARYCDVLLRKGNKATAGDAEVEEKLTRVIVLFKYIDDKDVFQKFYSRMLAKRLIYGVSVSDEAESNMISRLKNACGVEYTTKLQRMFTDVAVSADLSANFRKFTDNANIRLGVDTAVMVLTAGSWPLTGLNSSEFQLPEELEKSVVHFTTFYSKNHNGRKLSWLYHFSRADVKLNFCDKRYELNVSLYQLGTLLAFNGATTMSLQDIRNHTKLTDTELKRIIKVFQDIKLIIPSEKEGQGGPEYALNLGFTSKRIKIKVSTAMQMDTQQETDATHKAVDEDRKLYIQASIVRIMKSRKELSHTHLVQEVLDQARARFAPSVPMIKKCIEQLIEKQYIDRTKDSRDRYVYIS